MLPIVKIQILNRFGIITPSTAIESHKTLPEKATEMADSGEPISKRLRRRKDTNAPGSSESSKASGASSSGTVPTQTTAQSNIHPVSDSLLCLTDECLQHVFEYLDIESLCKMANVCKRFKPITEQAFIECHKELELKGQCDNSTFRRVLCKFGHLITSIDVSDVIFIGGEKLDVNAIVKYCKNKLEKLVLKETTINCDVIKPLFSRLKHLDVGSCEFTGNKSALFANCPKLEYFGFEADYGSDEIEVDFVVKKYPKLEHLAFDCSYTACFAFFRLLALNPQVKQLEIIAPAEDKYMEAVANYSKNLEELVIRTGYWSDTAEVQTKKGLLQLSKLKKLQQLHLSACDETYSELAAALTDAFAKAKVPINHLTLREFSIGSKEIKSILKLKTMKILNLEEVGKVTDADLVPLTKELPLLENLQLYFGSEAKAPITVAGLTEMVKNGKQLDYLGLVGVKNLKIDKKAFDSLLEAARARGNDKKLKIEIFGEEETTGFNVPDDIQRAGNKHLKIVYTAEAEPE